VSIGGTLTNTGSLEIGNSNLTALSIMSAITAVATTR
jgi:hypothetical protein